MDNLLQDIMVKAKHGDAEAQYKLGMLCYKISYGNFPRKAGGGLYFVRRIFKRIYYNGNGAPLDSEAAK